MEVYGWIRDYRLYHLTIGDILKCSVGDELDVVIFDRNFEESGIWDKLHPDVEYDPTEFFKYNHHKLKYNGDMKWDIIFNWGKTFEHPIHLNVEHLATRWTWVVLGEDGFVDIAERLPDDDKKTDNIRKSVRLHWNGFPSRTRIGWRGPIMLWEDLKNKRKVYYKKL